MQVGLIDADLMWQKHVNGRRYGKTHADIYPNIVMMKLSAWHKQQGDKVEWYNGLQHYDIVYISKVFSTTPTSKEYIKADKVIYGGSGWCITLENGVEMWKVPDNILIPGTFSARLPEEVEHIMPDYSIYPMVKDTAVGFLSRGCPRRCFFCHVAAKEGGRAYKVANLSEWWSGQKKHHTARP